MLEPDVMLARNELSAFDVMSARLEPVTEFLETHSFEIVLLIKSTPPAARRAPFFMTAALTTTKNLLNTNFM